jgi:hypothetical protein
MSQSDRDYSEKRDYIRMTIDAEVTLRFKGLAFSGVCIDLSSSGMQVQSQSQLAVGDVLAVHLPSPTPNLDPYDVDAEVVRIQDLGDGKQILGLATAPA